MIFLEKRQKSIFKIWQKIMFILLFFVLFTNSVKAKTNASINLTSSNNVVGVGDTFQLSVQFKNAGTGNVNIGDFNIPGIENFQEVGSSNSTQVQMINGSTTAITETVLTLVAKKTGNFKLGPVIINNGKSSAKSGVISIKVIKNSVNQNSIQNLKHPINSSVQNNSFFNLNNDTVLSNKKHKSEVNSILSMLWNIVMILLLIFLVYILYKRSGKEKNNIVNSNVASSVVDDRAEDKIEILNSYDPDFFRKTKLSLLKFIENRYGINTANLTSGEIKKEILKKNVSNSEEIIRALDLCDKGNFAGLTSNKDELCNIINNLNK